MADRLRWLTICDKALPEERRHFTDLGLTGLNLGQVSLWVQGRINTQSSPALQDSAAQWQQSLADAYQACARGHCDDRFRADSERLKTAMAEAGNMEQRNQELIAGAVERIALTFERMAARLAGTAELNAPAANTPGAR